MGYFIIFVKTLNVRVMSFKAVELAKAVLKENGYFVDNLWHVDDEKSKFKCTNEQAQDILLESLTNEATMEQVFFSIGEFGRIDNLEEINN